MAQIELSTYILRITVYFVLALLLLFMKIPKDARLKNYIISRRIIAMAYLCLVVSNSIHLFQGERILAEINLLSFSGRFILVSSLQALLFTYSLITLIDARYVTQKRVLGQLALIFIFYLPLSIALNIKNPIFIEISIYFFSAFYVFLLFYYISLFRTKIKQFIKASDDFFSGNEKQRIRWVKTIFYIAMCPIGWGALLVVLFPHIVLIETIFAIMCIFFYFYFGVGYINYLTDFFVLEPIVAGSSESIKVEDDITEENGFEDLNQKLERWTNNKGFTKGEITISELALQLKTNRTYLSNYINSSKNMNFNRWLNSLRIEEAKNRMKENPDTPLSELASQLGYVNLSSFSRQFSAIVGISPSHWRKSNL